MRHLPANVRHSLSIIIFPVLGNIVASLLQEWIGTDWRTRAGVIILFTLIGLAVVYFERRKESGGAEDARQAALTLRNRREMLHKVRTYWVVGVLQKSLHQEILIELDLKERPGAVIRPLDVLVRTSEGTELPLPPGSKIADVFDQMGRELLLLGAPGAGKTTLLLELTRDLLERAARDDAHPMPVVFPLSSWGETRRPLAAWLVDELSKRYNVPKKMGQPWVENNQILPLLDGLDEVEDMPACVEAINLFRAERGLLPIAVTCRRDEYDSLPKPLSLYNAVTVQPLTRARIDNYLAQVGEPMAAVRAALRDDPSLWELLDTPLMLNIMTLAYAGQAVAPAAVGSGLEERRQRLLAAYVERMFKRGHADAPYTREQTLRWLSWLARQMKEHGQTVFYIEQMQPDWLRPWQRWVPTIGVGLLLYLSMVYIYSLGAGRWAWLLAFTSWLAIFSARIEVVESIRWSWSEARSNFLSTLVSTAVFGGIIVWILGPLAGVALATSTLLSMSVVKGLTIGNLQTKVSPNEGIRRSLRNALIFGPVISLLGGVVVGMIVTLWEGIISGVFSALGVCIFVAIYTTLYFGGRTYLQHFALRLILVSNRSAPFNYARFLDYAAERIFLRKVGGGYVFIHRWLLEHFAARNAAPAVPAGPGGAA